jgi:hypothetical protein
MRLLGPEPGCQARFGIIVHRVDGINRAVEHILSSRHGRLGCHGAIGGAGGSSANAAGDAASAIPKARGRNQLKIAWPGIPMKSTASFLYWEST